jgi:tRNA G18 (ribose-2'-O)-methylase SpoU
VGALIELDDAADPRLADYVALTDVARRRSSEVRAHDEAEYGIFVAEGEPVVRRALACSYRMRSLLVDAKRVDQLADVTAQSDAPTFVAGPALLRDLTGFHVHRGVLASFARKTPLSVADLLAQSRRLLVCEALTSTTNLGAVLRSSAALGMDGVLLSPDCCDPLYRRAVRVSMGESLRLPIARAAGWPEPLADVRAAGFTVLALTPAETAPALPDVLAGLTSAQRIALLLGEEGPGLRADSLAAADERVRIPMHGGVDSLNVAAAATIACYLVGAAYPEPP